MQTTRRERVEGYFRALGRGDVEGAIAATTPDVILDRRNSNAPWRGLFAGQDQMREGFAEFREAWDELEGVRWEATEFRQVGRDLFAVGTHIVGRGRASGIEIDARGGWLIRFDGDLIAEGVLHQSFDEALLQCRRRTLEAARLYFVCEARPEGKDPSPLLEAAIRGGVDVIQMREKAPRCAEELIAFSEPFRRVARDHGALFFLNDEPGLVEACGADGVHVGQDDPPVAEARAEAGATALVGLSTHSPEQFDAAVAAESAARPDQISIGPVWETPTKKGRPATGLELVAHAVERDADVAWFAIGGIELGNVAEVVAAGARRIVVVRAIRDAEDAGAAARALRAALPG
jgi:thiamine-phosphate pyrophosphorylase